MVELASARGEISAAKNALDFADQIALDSTSGDRAAETQKRLALMRQETALLVSAVGKKQKRHDEESASEISRPTAELGQDVPPESGLWCAFKSADASLNAQVETFETSEAGIAERAETIKGLEQNVASLTKGRDVALSEQDALIPVEESETPGDDGGAAPEGLNDQITDKSRELSAELEQQSTEPKHLEVARAKLPKLQRAADPARMNLEAAETALLQAWRRGDA